MPDYCAYVSADLPQCHPFDPLGDLFNLLVSYLIGLDSGAFLVGLCVGFWVYGPTSRNPSLASAIYLFLTTMAVQIEYAFSELLHGIGATQALMPALWFPVRGLCALGLGCGVVIYRRRHHLSP